MALGWFTPLRFLLLFCANCRPPRAARELAHAISAGRKEWEVRRIGKHRWRVRLHLVNEEARAIMADPESHLSKELPLPAHGGCLQATERPRHPGFVLTRIPRKEPGPQQSRSRGIGNQEQTEHEAMLDPCTIALTTHGWLGASGPVYILKLAGDPAIGQPGYGFGARLLRP
jgi:hypothetical protein